MTSLAMRLNADVLHIIFGHLDDPAEPSNQRGKALVNAAMTCKNFYQPALRVIWRKLDDLFPLFKLFSSFVMVRACRYYDQWAEKFYVSLPLREFLVRTVSCIFITLCMLDDRRCHPPRGMGTVPHARRVRSNLGFSPGAPGPPISPGPTIAPGPPIAFLERPSVFSDHGPFSIVLLGPACWWDAVVTQSPENALDHHVNPMYGPLVPPHISIT